MSNSCMNCKHFDDCDTELTLCLLHKCFKRADDTCGDFMSRDETKTHDNDMLGESDGQT